MKRLRVAATLVGAAVAMGLCAMAHPQVPIRIGASLSLTGTFAELGQTFDRGYRVCMKQANDRGGVPDRTIDLCIEDDKSDAAASAAIYEKLIARDKVDAVFSPYSSGITEGMADVTERHRMLLFQWQDGRKVIVWPQELSAVTARFPTPPWGKRP